MDSQYQYYIIVDDCEAVKWKNFRKCWIWWGLMSGLWCHQLSHPTCLDVFLWLKENCKICDSWIKCKISASQGYPMYTQFDCLFYLSYPAFFFLFCSCSLVFNAKQMASVIHAGNTLAGERQEPASDHSHGPGGGGRLHRLLDSHPRLRHHHGSHQHPQLHAADHHLAFLHRPGLHEQVQTQQWQIYFWCFRMKVSRTSRKEFKSFLGALWECDACCYFTKYENLFSFYDMYSNIFSFSQQKPGCDNSDLYWSVGGRSFLKCVKMVLIFMPLGRKRIFNSSGVNPWLVLLPLCSSLNPVLYGYLDENFKRCFREFCTPSPSVVEMQNSSRTGAGGRKLPPCERISAKTGERSNQQVRQDCVSSYKYIHCICHGIWSYSFSWSSWVKRLITCSFFDSNKMLLSSPIYFSLGSLA